MSAFPVQSRRAAAGGWRSAIPAIFALSTLAVAAGGGAWAQQVPSVGVRSGDHDTYTRVVFDWPRKVGYKVSRDGGLVTLTFDAAAAFQTARINRTPPLFVNGVRGASSSSTSVAVIAVPVNARIRNLAVGNKVVVDVFEPSEWQDPVALPAKVSVPGGETTKLTPRKKTVQASQSPPAAEQVSAPPASKKPEKPKAAPSAPVPAPESAAIAQPAPRPLTPVLSAAPAPIDQAALSPPPATAANAPISLAPKEGSQESQSPQSPQLPEASSTPSGEGSASGGSTSAASLGGRATGSGPVDDAKTTFSSEGDAVTLRFDWDEPVAAAVFRRGNNLWVVFDKRTNVDMEALAEAGDGVIKGVEQVLIPQATVLRLQTPSSSVNPAVKRDGLAWLLEFKRQALVARTPLEIEVEPDSPLGARVFVPLTEPGKVIPLTDPIALDNLVVVPAIPLGHGIGREHVYPQFRLPRTAQGVVVEPLIDDLRVRALRQGVELASSAPTAPLRISPVSTEAAASARLLSSRPLTRLLDLGRWQAPNFQAIVQNRKMLQDILTESPKGQREEARFNLARFYVANGYGAEALGVMALMAEKNEKILDNQEFRLLRGIAHYEMGRISEARADFNFPALDGNDEAEFWRAIEVLSRIDASDANRADAAIELRRTGPIARPYPRDLRNRLGIVIGEAAVIVGDVENATNILNALTADQPSPSQQARITFVQGKLAELTGDFDGAVALWEEVIDGTDRLFRFRAVQARVDLLTQLQTIDPKEAIKEMEKLRFAWRGDRREFNLLRRLGELYLSEGEYRKGLQTLRQAATHFRKLEEAKEITKIMSDTFSALFLEGKADELPPVTAIAIYEEFKELSPAGRKGDETIQRLAERLADIDLLDQAANLLEEQVKFRLSGVDKARVGARLAEIRIASDRGGDAERAIKESEVPGLPAALVQRRNRITARAISQQDRDTEAISVLAPDESPEAELLRARIFWNNTDWLNAARSLQRVVRGFDRGRQDPLTDPQAKLVMSLAIAMTLAGNERGLEMIRADYGPLMALTEYGDGFNLIVARPEQGLLPVAQINRKVEIAEKFKDFLTSYETRVRENPEVGLN